MRAAVAQSTACNCDTRERPLAATARVIARRTRVAYSRLDKSCTAQAVAHDHGPRAPARTNTCPILDQSQRLNAATRCEHQARPTAGAAGRTAVAPPAFRGSGHSPARFEHATAGPDGWARWRASETNPRGRRLQAPKSYSDGLVVRLFQPVTEMDAWPEYRHVPRRRFSPHLRTRNHLHHSRRPPPC